MKKGKSLDLEPAEGQITNGRLAGNDPLDLQKNRQPEAVAIEPLKEEIIKKWAELRQFAKDGRQFILFIGKAGAAKTVIMTSLCDYSSRTNPTLPDPLGNRAGVRYINERIQKMQAGVFPDANPEVILEYYDATIYTTSGEKMPVILVEMAGESLKHFDPSEAVKDPFFQELAKFLALRPRLITFLVAPADAAAQLDLFFQATIAHLRKWDEELVRHLGLIVSKWDLRPSEKQRLRSFIRKEMPRTNKILETGLLVPHAKFFRFSVGRVAGDRIEELQLKDCRSLLVWIEDLLIRQPMRDALANVEREVITLEDELGATRDLHGKARAEISAEAERRERKRSKRGILGSILRLFTL